MDWAIGQGYAGLVDSTNKRQAAKEELGVLQQLSQQMKADRLEKEQADLKEQAYMEEVSKFADTLLAPDRTKINQKSKVLSQMIREHVKANGGDMTKFFANNGHKILGDYKSSLINSEESSQYIDNKKNMERIVDLQMKGFGHLINTTDLFNLENYQKNGGGKITYTGQLNEVKMPDLKEFDMGYELKADDILYYEGNYTKFLGNYKMEFPSAEFPPTEQQLKDYVTSKHSGMVGQNWQKDLGYKKESFDQTMAVANYEAGRDDEQTRRDEWVQTFNQNVANTEFDQRMAMRRLALEEAAAEGLTGTDAETKADTDVENNMGWVSNVSEMTSSIGYDIKDITQINANSFNPFATTFGLPVLEDFKTGAEDYSDSGSGGILRQGDGNSMKDALAKGYAVRGSKLLINGHNATQAVKASGLFTIDEKENVINGLDVSQHTDMFDAQGRKIAHWSTKPGDKGFITKTYSEDVANRKFKVTGVVTGFFGQDQADNEILVMNQVTGKGSSKVDTKGTKEYERRIKKNVNGAGLFVVIESPQGDRFYKPLRGDTDLTLFAKWGGAGTKSTQQAINAGRDRAEKVRFENEKAKQIVLGAVDEVNRDKNLTNRIIQDARLIPGASAAAVKHTPLIMAYYAQARVAHSKAGNNVSMNDLQSTGNFNEMMQYVNSNENYKKEFNRLINTPGTDGRKIIDFLIKIDAVDAANGEGWKNSYQFIRNRK